MRVLMAPRPLWFWNGRLDRGRAGGRSWPHAARAVMLGLEVDRLDGKRGGLDLERGMG